MGLSQEAVAVRLGTSASACGNWERGRDCRSPPEHHAAPDPSHIDGRLLEPLIPPWKQPVRSDFG
ncbi:helix-turn-helix transcriptional regulator [Streptomyces sp. CBMA152]|uniref:helix-turn-helix domain-containing protein n=1 Tax=Streptomyces sp. CBMA152 TaxID=1896312 RepID=UPI0021D40E15|nr:helix-turn-helix transcriptional regulator [Streptomyces sp. CBMA152]